MDEIAVAFPEEGSSSYQRLHGRTTSFASSSQTPAQPFSRQPRIRTPSSSLRHRSSFTSVHSNTSNTSDIIAPIPRRHHTLQAHESRHWLDTPPLSPSAARSDSPMSNVTLSPQALRPMASLTAVLEDTQLDVSFPTQTRQRHTYKKESSESSMARRWARWMHHHGMKDWIIPWVTLVAVLIRWCVGLGSYSGQNTPPLFGDYEAQRHWMELTIHLPVRQWYTYDLQYWGLDYPPLTAYISWLCGKIGSAIDPSWFALDKSRGIETSGSKVYMRSTVLIFDLLVYFPAIILFTKIWQANRSVRTQHVALITLLLQPALIIIDFGHFQYNSVMLGFALLALDLFASDNDLLGALCFVLSLGFKQMALYYAPAIGSYLIAKCLSLGPANGRLLFFRLAVTTLASFIILFLPFLPPFTPLSDIMQPIIRIFPFARGLFEDKVANFWCATNVVFKWKFWVSKGALVKLSTLFTAVGFLPSVLGLIYSGYRIGVLRREEKQNDQKESTATNPLLSLLPYALLASSMSFFLFSFQVHEKTILVPLLPLTLLMSSSAADSVTFELGVLANNVAMFSMWPLLQRDGLGIQYIALTLLWNRLIGYNPFRSKPTSFIHLISLAVYAAIILLHIAEFVISPPSHLPDLFPVLNVLISTPVFALVWLWSIKRGVEVSWAMGTLSSSSSHQPTSGNQHSNAYSRATSVARSDIGDEVQSATSSLATPVEFPSLIATKKRTCRTRSLGFARGDKIKLEWEREKERERVVSLGPGAAR